MDRAFAQAHVVAQYGVMVRYVDDVCTYIDKNGDRLWAPLLYQLSRRLVYQGTMIVAVKIGLAILLPLFAGRAVSQSAASSIQATP